jgi:hypothetical protein
MLTICIWFIENIELLGFSSTYENLQQKTIYHDLVNFMILLYHLVDHMKSLILELLMNFLFDNTCNRQKATKLISLPPLGLATVSLGGSFPIKCYTSGKKKMQVWIPSKVSEMSLPVPTDSIHIHKHELLYQNKVIQCQIAINVLEQITKRNPAYLAAIATLLLNKLREIIGNITSLGILLPSELILTRSDL